MLAVFARRTSSALSPGLARRAGRAPALALSPGRRLLCSVKDQIRDASEAWQAQLASSPEEPPLRFPVGAPVECLVAEDTWASGKVVAQYYREDGFPDGAKVPYQVLVDDEFSKGKLNAVWAPADDDVCIRSALRFQLGDVVECLLGKDEGDCEVWARGMVVAHFHSEPSWAKEQWAPYQVQLERIEGAADSALLSASSGQLIWAPLDVDACIRAPS